MTLLDPTDYRGLHPDSTLDDASLQLLLDAAEDEIDRYAGPVGSVEELFYNGGRLLVLSRQAASITSIEETSLSSNIDYDPALDATDYIIWPQGTTIERVPGGTTSRHTFRGRTRVTYTPVDDTNIRKVVQSDLVALMESFRPGTTSETVGAWSRQLAANSVWNNSMERDAILSRLRESGRMVVT